MSGVEQQHLRSAQSSRSLCLPQAAGGEVPAEVTALSLGHCPGQLSNNQICAALGAFSSLFKGVPWHNPLQNSITKCEVLLLGGDKYCQNIQNTSKFVFFPLMCKI